MLLNKLYMYFLIKKLKNEKYHIVSLINLKLIISLIFIYLLVLSRSGGKKEGGEHDNINLN